MNIAESIQTIMMDCLYKDEEIIDLSKPPEGAILVEGIVQKFGFHPVRLQAHKEEVKEILRQMPEQFHLATGGGWSFLNLCNDKDGHQWGEHNRMEELVCLAIGLGIGAYCLPRSDWAIFPGGVPYIVFDLDGIEKEDLVFWEY